MSGRDDLGFNKIWCDIPDPRVINDRREYEASWLGFKFIEATFEPTSAGEKTHRVLPRMDIGIEGTLNHKFVPRTGSPGEADVSYIAFWPEFSVSKIDSVTPGKGTFRFNKATWEQLPTMHHVINALADLPIHEIVACDFTVGSGQGAVSNMEILV